MLSLFIRTLAFSGLFKVSTPIFLQLVNGVELFSLKYLFSLVFVLKYKYYLSEENHPANENFILYPF